MSDSDKIDGIIKELNEVKNHLDTAKYSLDDVHVLRRLAINLGVLAHEIAVACT